MASEVFTQRQSSVLFEGVSSSILEKPILKKRPRVSNDTFEQNKRHYISAVLFGRKSQQMQEQPGQNDFKFANNADEIFPSSNYVEQTNNNLETNPVSALTSDDLLSFEQGDTPASKTKRYGHGIHGWFNKIQYYSRQSPFLRSRSERDHQFINATILSSPVEDLPEDAYSCYNQYRTQNFNDCFDTLKLKKPNSVSRDLGISAFPSLNDLSYESLQDLRKKLQALPPFSADSNFSQKLDMGDKISERFECKEDENTKVTEYDTHINVIEVEAANDEAELSAYFHSPKSERDETGKAQEVSDQVNSTESQPIEDFVKTEIVNNSTETELANSVESHPVVSSVSQESLTTTSTPTPEIIRLLYNDTIQSGEQFELDSSQFRHIDNLSIKDAVLTPIEHDTLSLSSHSTYSPISIVVPALKQNHNIISDIAENLSEGQLIDPIYDPDDYQSHSAQEDNDHLDIRDPSSYETSPSSTTSSQHSTKSIIDSRISTIKFDKFAQLLLYDGKRRSKYNKVRHHFPAYDQYKNVGNKRQDAYKNRGSLSLSPTLYPNSFGKLRTLRLAKFSKFTTINSFPNIDQIVEIPDEDGLSIPVKPILKSKHNKNAEFESVRARFCDDVDVADFMEFFENHEIHRQESEPYLERIRERQLLTYYSSEESSPTTNDTTFSV